jgi:hypothetical protein
LPANAVAGKAGIVAQDCQTGHEIERISGTRGRAVDGSSATMLA